MEGVRQYILTVIAAAILCSIICSLVVGKGTYTAVLKVICGLFLTITIMSPVINIEIIDLEEYFKGLQFEADAVVDEGQMIAHNEKIALMQQNLEAFLLEKAKAIDLEISADITIDDETCLPSAVTIWGDVSPYSKQILSQFIEENLGIPEEDQSWI